MNRLPDCLDWITYSPSDMHPELSTGIWYTNDIIDVNEIRVNIFTLGDIYKDENGENWDDIYKCANFIKRFPFVFVAIPDAEKCRAAAQELRLRLLGATVCYANPEAFKGCKNLREYAERYGKEKLFEMLLAAVELPSYGFINIADVKRPEKIHAVPSGITELDKAIGGFADGCLSVWTGRRGEGKSTLLGQILLNGINEGNKACAYSGELVPYRMKDILLLQAAGKNNVVRCTETKTGKEYYRETEETGKKIDEWWSNELLLYNITMIGAHKEDNIMELFEFAAKRGCKIFLVDNIMTTELNPGKDFYRAQSSFVARLCAFAKRTQSHVHLVAHPRKADAKRALDADDVGGIGDITNLADNVFALERISDDDPQSGEIDSMLSILKNRDYGSRNRIGLLYDPITRRFSSKSGVNFNIRYSWEYQNA